MKQLPKEYTLEDLVSDEALASRLVNLLWKTHHWAGTVFCREDIESAWVNHYEMNDKVVPPFTDEMWGNVTNSPLWQEMDETLTIEGFNIVDQIINQVRYGNALN
jgi:hypothetical protein